MPMIEMSVPVNEKPLPDDKKTLEVARRELLERIESWLEVPMLFLSFVWLILVGIEMLWERAWEENAMLSPLSTAIWIIFIFDFLVELIIAPRKFDYLKRNWLTACSLIIPGLRIFRAFRVFRVFRAASAVRTFRLVKVVGSLNRGMRALGSSMGRRGFGYVVALTVIITLSGAAGMYAFEHAQPNGFNNYGDALWWTSMIMTTLGSAYWPQTPEGRVLCVILALYAFAVFGYVTATLATYFIGSDTRSEVDESAVINGIMELKVEMSRLRAEIGVLTEHKRSPDQRLLDDN